MQDFETPNPPIDHEKMSVLSEISISSWKDYQEKMISILSQKPVVLGWSVRKGEKSWDLCQAEFMLFFSTWRSQKIWFFYIFQRRCLMEVNWNTVDLICFKTLVGLSICCFWPMILAFRKWWLLQGMRKWNRDSHSIKRTQGWPAGISSKSHLANWAAVRFALGVFTAEWCWNK